MLQTHVKPSVWFELPYAQDLDDALTEADAEDLPTVSGETTAERNLNGICLFSTFEELEAVFREWEAGGDDSDHDRPEASPDHRRFEPYLTAANLRSFVAQRYIHPPYLVGARQFGIRAYVVAVGNLRVYVYRELYARFPEKEYQGPWHGVTPDLAAHVASSGPFNQSVGHIPERDLGEALRQSIFDQIRAITRDVFHAAATERMDRFMTYHNAFEVFGLGFLVGGEGAAWLLEVNNGPGYPEAPLQGSVQKLFDEIVDVAVKPYFGLDRSKVEGSVDMVQVLHVHRPRKSFGFQPEEESGPPTDRANH